MSRIAPSYYNHIRFFNRPQQDSAIRPSGDIMKGSHRHRHGQISAVKAVSPLVDTPLPVRRGLRVYEDGFSASSENISPTNRYREAGAWQQSKDRPRTAAPRDGLVELRRSDLTTTGDCNCCNSLLWRGRSEGLLLSHRIQHFAREVQQQQAPITIQNSVANTQEHNTSPLPTKLPQKDSLHQERRKAKWSSYLPRDPVNATALGAASFILVVCLIRYTYRRIVTRLSRSDPFGSRCRIPNRRDLLLASLLGRLGD